MNILRDQLLKTKIRNGFHFQLGRKRATWVSLTSCACSWESTENCRRAQRSAGFGQLALGGQHFRIHRLIDDPTCSRTGEALFLTLNKALEHGMIGDDKDFFKEGLRDRSGRTLSLSESYESKVGFRAAMQATVGNRTAAEGALLKHTRSRQHPRKCWFFAIA